MEMLKAALCCELRNLLGVLDVAYLYPTSPAHKEKLCRKIESVCERLDLIDMAERAQALGKRP